MTVCSFMVENRINLDQCVSIWLGKHSYIVSFMISITFFENDRTLARIVRPKSNFLNFQDMITILGVNYI